MMPLVHLSSKHTLINVLFIDLFIDSSFQLDSLTKAAGNANKC